MKKLENKNRKL